MSTENAKRLARRYKPLRHPHTPQAIYSVWLFASFFLSLSHGLVGRFPLFSSEIDFAEAGTVAGCEVPALGRKTQNLGGESCVVMAFLLLRFVDQLW